MNHLLYSSIFSSLSKNKSWILIGSIAAVFFSIVILMNVRISDYQEFFLMADSFLHGKLYFINPPTDLLDTVWWQGHYYWSLGLFPIILFMPFVLLAKIFSFTFYQGYLQIIITGLVFFIALRIAQRFAYNSRDSFYLAFAFCFASIYQFAAFVTYDWYFVQTLTVLLQFLAIYEYLGKRRYWLIGMMLGFTFASRFTAGLAIIFFILAIWQDGSLTSVKQRWRAVATVLFPVILTGLILLWYNYARFGNPLENGYRLVNKTIMTEAERFELTNYGLFQLRNIPTNFYYYFLKGIDPVTINFQSFNGPTYILKPPYLRVNHPGVSFFFIAPIFLYLFRANYKEKLVRWSLITAAVILFLLLTYYWSGWLQLGPRYLLDLLPFAYLALLYSFPKFQLTKPAKILIIISAFLDLYLFFMMMS